MIRSSCLIYASVGVLACLSTTAAVTFNVDTNDAGCSDVTGTPYCTIQAAVDDAAALDNPAAPGGTGQTDPVNIVIFAGSYAENVDIPADAAGSNFNTENDGWTIAANTGDRVVIEGGISMGVGRDNCTFNGINIKMTAARAGYSFGETARSNTVKNAFIYNGGSLFGNSFGLPAISNDRLFGTNFFDHLTIVGNDQGIVLTNTSTASVANSIFAYNDQDGLSATGGNPNNIEFSDVFGNSPDYNDLSKWQDGGNNINFPSGSAPLFASLDPNNASFLFIQPTSPCFGTASSAGDFTAGQLNMGALPSAPAQADPTGACCDIATGICSEITAQQCLAAGNTYSGDGSSCAGVTCEQTLFEVGAGKQFATIQAAVDAAAALDDPGAANHTARPDPVQIVVFAGEYNETVSVPADAAGSNFNTANDGWTIRANDGDRVLVKGGISVGNGRDNCTFDGINVEMINTGGYYFDQTARSNTIKNAIIYGGRNTAPNFAAINSNRLFGTNFVDHVTLFNNDFGVLATNTSGYVITNSVVAFNDIGLRNLQNSGFTVSFTDNFNAQNCEGLGGTDSCASINDGGGNLGGGLDSGLDPRFDSTSPLDADFLFLAANSPAAGAASTAGRFTDGQANMGALPATIDDAVIGACCQEDGTCAEMTAAGCSEVAGLYQGDGVTCDSVNCSPFTGVCCLPNGTCDDQIDDVDCAAQNGIFKGFGTSCAVEGQACSATGSCCLPDESCIDTNEADCTLVQGGVYNGDGTSCAGTNCQRTFQVGEGREFATIQEAVDAAAQLDDPGATQNQPAATPVQVIVFEGVYDEVVSIPADAAGSTFNTANDGWIVRANTGDTVLIRGGISVGLGRDNCTFDGLNIQMSGTSGYNFGNTARSNTIKNAVIFGGRDAAASEFAAINSNFLFGTNFVDHVTVFDNDFGLLATNTSGYVVSNTIVNGNKIGLRRLDPVNGWGVSYSDNYNPAPDENCEGPGGILSCASIGDAGNNVNWPDGLDPVFLSTDPLSNDFLRLNAATSPCFGTGSSAGAYTNGEANIGAFASGSPSPAELGACCNGGVCSDSTLIACVAAGGAYLGTGTSCATTDCTQGACCSVDGSTCTETTEAGCTGTSIYRGDGTTCATVVCEDFGPDPIFDRDRDGDVDQTDFREFQLCLSGSGNPYPAGCDWADRPEPGFPDGDGDVDGDDFGDVSTPGTFLFCASGPEIPADVSCDDPL